MGLLDFLANLISNNTPIPTPVGQANFEHLIAAINAQRSNFGLPAYSKSPALETIAQDWANKMAAKGRMDHGDFSGRIKLHIPNLTAAGEDIAEGQQTVEAVVKAWMNSPPHRANILNQRFTQIGVGIATAKNGDIFWCLDFDRLRD